MCQCLTASVSAGCHEPCGVDVHRWSPGSDDCSPGSTGSWPERDDRPSAGGFAGGGPVLLLATTGRRPGNRHVTPLVLHRDDDGSLYSSPPTALPIGTRTGSSTCRRRDRWRRPPRKRHGAGRRRSHDGLSVSGPRISRTDGRGRSVDAGHPGDSRRCRLISASYLGRRSP
jgi:hypothetical protein